MTRYFIMHEEEPRPASKIMPLLLAILGAVSIVIAFIIARKAKKTGQKTWKDLDKKKKGTIVVLIGVGIALVVAAFVWWKKMIKTPQNVAEGTMTVTTSGSEATISTPPKPNKPGIFSGLASAFGKIPSLIIPKPPVVPAKLPGKSEGLKPPKYVSPSKPSVKLGKVVKTVAKPLSTAAKLAFAPLTAISSIFKKKTAEYEWEFEVDGQPDNVILVVKDSHAITGGNTTLPVFGGYSGSSRAMRWRRRMWEFEDYVDEDGVVVPAAYQFAAYETALSDERDIAVSTEFEDGEDFYERFQYASWLKAIAGALVPAYGAYSAVKADKASKSVTKTASDTLAKGSGMIWAIVGLIIAVIVAFFVWKLFIKKTPQGMAISGALGGAGSALPWSR